MNYSKILDALVNKFHVILGAVTQGVILAWHFKTGHDIGSNVQTTVSWWYGFLAGHALTYQKYPDTQVADTTTPQIVDTATPQPQG